MTKLTEIANACGTDKGTIVGECHGFTEFYDRYFREMKDRAIEEGRKISILEVGIYHGESLKMFNEYFGNWATVYGIDINLEQNQYWNERNIIGQVDANSRESVESFLNQIGNIKFDIILDDASHIAQHQIHTILYLHNSLRENGIYIIEDLHCGLFFRQQSPLYYLMFKDKLPFMTDEENTEIEGIIDDVIVYANRNPKSAYDKQSVTSIIKFKKPEN